MEPKVVICFPSGELVSTQFVLSLVNLLLRNKTVPAVVSNCSSSRIAFNRNTLVLNALATDASHILFVDADMIFPHNALDVLLSHNLNIVGATAARRKMGDNDAIGWTLDGERLKIPSPPVKMKVLGLPFMLIRREVFEKLPQPWFAEPPWNRFGEVGNPGLVPEDEYFCHIARDAGYDIYCDIELSMKIGHRGAETFYIMKPE